MCSKVLPKMDEEKNIISLETTVAEHGQAIKGIVNLVQSLKDDVKVLSDRIQENSKFPVGNVLNVMTIGIVIMSLFAGYFKTEINTINGELDKLREIEIQLIRDAAISQENRRWLEQGARERMEQKIES